MYDTKLLSSDITDVEYAAQLIRKGEVVGMPTETVYGLAADACDEQAVGKIFAAKGRPSDNPLIVHLSSADKFEDYAHDVPDTAYKIAEKFCPGPLTMVLPKRDNIPFVTSGGLQTVGIRIPFHKTARQLIELSGKAIAAPSANLSGSPSPTSAQHVMDDMNGKIPAIIDGGVCSVGIESTVISFENGAIRVLRPGFVSAEDLSIFGVPVLTDNGILESVSENERVLSPGMKYKHYSPKANVTLIHGEYENFIRYVKNHNKSGVCAVVFDSDKPIDGVKTAFYGDTAEEQAAKLFAVLRSADEHSFNQLYFRYPSEKGVGLAVCNRLLRAAGFEVIYV